MAMTPLEYVTRWRMEIAKKARLDRVNSVTDVAECVGYKSDTAFARVFKKETGLFPSGFKKSEQARAVVQ